MKCIHCESEHAAVFLIEHLPCSHCNKQIDLVYSNCPECFIVWKSIDGEILGTSFDDTIDFNAILDLESSLEIPEELEKLMVDAFANISDQPETSMAGLMHKCLRCDTIAYETKPRFYHCPDCGFEWEVL